MLRVDVCLAVLSLICCAGAWGQDVGQQVSAAQREKYLTLSQMERLVRHDQPIHQVLVTLGQLGQRQAAVPFLLQGLRSPRASYVNIMLQELERTQPLDEEAIRVLLDRGDVASRVVLIHVGAAVFPQVRLELASGNEGRICAALSLLKLMADEEYPRLDYEEFVPTCVEMLGHAELTQRFVALDALRSFGPSARTAVPAMVELLQDERLLIVETAITVLGEVGPQAEAAIPALTRLSAERALLGAAVAKTLGRIGPAAVASLTQMLSLPGDEVRIAAAQALARIGPDAKAAVMELTPLLADENWRIRAEAALALWSITGDAEPLGKALQEAIDQDVGFGIAAVLRVGPAGKQAVDRFMDLKVVSKGRKARRDAVIALSALGPEAAPAVPVLMRLLETDPEEECVAQALARIGRPALPALRAALMSTNSELRADAAVALKLMGPLAEEALPDLLPIIENHSGRDQEEAENAVFGITNYQLMRRPLPEYLKRLEQDEALQVATRVYLVNRGQDLRVGLGPALQAYRDEQLEQRIAQLSDPRPVYRAIAADEMIAYGPLAGRAEPFLRVALDDVSLRVRQRAAAALWAMGKGDEQIQQILSDGLKYPDADIRREVVQLYGQLGPTAAPAVGSLLEMLNDPYMNVQLFAAEAIAAIDPARPEPAEFLMRVLEHERYQRRWGPSAAALLDNLGRSARPMLPRLKRVQFLGSRTTLLEDVIDAQRQIEMAE